MALMALSMSEIMFCMCSMSAAIALSSSSGYRSPEYNKKIGGSGRSAHCTGEAIDIAAPDKGTLKQFILHNPDFIEDLGLYFEDFDYTKTWVHMTIRPPRSGRRFFQP